MREKCTRILLSAAVACGSALGVGAQSADLEAAVFLSNMPAGLQALQERAVREAMAGDCSALEAVRMSRNRPFEVPEDIAVFDMDGGHRLYLPAERGADAVPVLVYLHGGGWCFGSVNSCADFCVNVVREAGMAVLAVEYPLAPENPYPDALDCCVAAVRSLASQADDFGLDANAISVGGDSAGGNLALATALRLMDAERPDSAGPMVRLKSLVLFYPVVKVWNDGSRSWNRYEVGYGLDGGIMEAFNEAYAGEYDVKDPLISPFCASEELLRQLPPVLIVNAERDILCDQGDEMSRRLSESGVDCRRVVIPGSVHLFITVAGQPTAFRMAVESAAAFLRQEP